MLVKCYHFFRPVMSLPNIPFQQEMFKYMDAFQMPFYWDSIFDVPQAEVAFAICR